MATKANATSIAANEIIEPARHWAVKQLSDKHNHHLIAELWHHWFPLTYHTVAQSRNKAVCHAIESIAAHRFSLPADRLQKNNWLCFFFSFHIRQYNKSQHYIQYVNNVSSWCSLSPGMCLVTWRESVFVYVWCVCMRLYLHVSLSA